MPSTFMQRLAPADFRLVIHAGAGGRIPEFTRVREQEFKEALAEAFTAGESVLAAGGSALDAVCASVRAMEDCPLFNAGRGAALTLEGGVELDASVMTGTGETGAVIAVREVKNPVDLARVVMEKTPHVLLTHPSVSLAREHGLEVVVPEYFVTEARKEQLARILAKAEAPLKHGTVGAVAVDTEGRLAAATSTGGISKQYTGRVGDTPIVGAGTWASEHTAAISCTGDGEAFIASSFAHDVHARLRYAGADLADALHGAFTELIEPRDSTGGAIAVTRDGSGALAFNAAMMFAAYSEGGELTIWTGAERSGEGEIQTPTAS